jgi:hypothetical protein
MGGGNLPLTFTQRISNMSDSNAVELTLSSGFKVSVTPLPPYYIDWIDDVYPVPKPPMRKLKLAAGDEVEYDYIVPKSAPDEKNIEDYGLYLKYKDFLKKSDEIARSRERAKRDFLLSNCIKILSGPIDIDKDEWEKNVEAPFENYTVPLHPGKRMLAFMKAVVIHSTIDYQAVIKVALYQEVNMQSILNALSSFRPSLAGQETGGNS